MPQSRLCQPFPRDFPAPFSPSFLPLSLHLPSIPRFSSFQRVNRCVLPQGWAPLPPSWPSIPGMDLETGGSPDLISKTNTLEPEPAPCSALGHAGAGPGSGLCPPLLGSLLASVPGRCPSFAAGLVWSWEGGNPHPESLWVGFYGTGAAGASTGADGWGKGWKMNIKTPNVTLSAAQGADPVKKQAVCLQKSPFYGLSS